VAKIGLYPNLYLALLALGWRIGEVHLWHGELDINVPISVGRYVADAIPNCHATFLKDEAHFSLPNNHIREILNILVA